MLLLTQMTRMKDEIIKLKEQEYFRYYFITLIIKPDMNEDAVMVLLRDILESPTMKKLLQVEDLKMCGKKKMTYAIKKNFTGTYCTALIKVVEDDDLRITLNEIHRLLRANSEILRISTIRYAFGEDILPDNLSHMKTYMDKHVEKELKR